VRDHQASAAVPAVRDHRGAADDRLRSDRPHALSSLRSTPKRRAEG
jgi:hypothetical protein